jgi:hypothetical protein
MRCGLGGLETGSPPQDFGRQIHEPIDRIRAAYGETICADEDFWRQRREAAYATLIELAEPVAIDAFPCSKRDRRGWVALTPPQLSLAF